MNRQSGQSLYPGGAQEVKDADFGWETMQKIVQETVVSGSDIDDAYNELRFPMAPGESIEWSLVLLLGGNNAADATIKVVVPGTPSGGGFTLMAMELAGNNRTDQYGVSDFNSFVGLLRGGPSSILDSYDTHFLQGSVQCGDDPGVLRFQLSGTGFIVKPGSLLRVRRAGVL